MSDYPNDARDAVELEQSKRAAMTDSRAGLRDIPRFLPGEEEAIRAVVALGAQYGYGNLISRLSDAWSGHLQKKGMDKRTADHVGRHICAWCDVDSRTGKKVKRLKPKKQRGKKP